MFPEAARHTVYVQNLFVVFTGHALYVMYRVPVFVNACAFTTKNQCCGAEIIYFRLRAPTLAIISAPAPAPAPATAIYWHFKLF